MKLFVCQRSDTSLSYSRANQSIQDTQYRLSVSTLAGGQSRAGLSGLRRSSLHRRRLRPVQAGTKCFPPFLGEFDYSCQKLDDPILRHDQNNLLNKTRKLIVISAFLYHIKTCFPGTKQNISFYLTLWITVSYGRALGPLVKYVLDIMDAFYHICVFTKSFHVVTLSLSSSLTV